MAGYDMKMIKELDDPENGCKKALNIQTMAIGQCQHISIIFRNYFKL